MRRRLTNVAAAVSLALCALTVALWMRSHWRGDVYRLDGDRNHAFVSEQGTLTCQSVRSSPAAAASKPAGRWKYYSYEAGGSSPSSVATKFGSGTYQLLGVQFRHETFVQRGGRVDAVWTAVVPYWLLVLATGLSPVVWVR